MTNPAVEPRLEPWNPPDLGTFQGSYLGSSIAKIYMQNTGVEMSRSLVRPCQSQA
jgi:hypothetical protein